MKYLRACEGFLKYHSLTWKNIFNHRCADSPSFRTPLPAKRTRVQKVRLCSSSSQIGVSPEEGDRMKLKVTLISIEPHQKEIPWLEIESYGLIYLIQD